jgi:predicted nucleic acid-binding protein
VTALLRAGRLAATAVTVFEIWRGLRSDEERRRARRGFAGVRVFPLTDVAARRAAEVDRALLANPVGERDTFIAGICLAVNRPILTRNVRHFRRVAGLEVVEAR